MLRIIFCSFLLLIFNLGQAQQAGMLFGLNAENKLCKIDPASGEISVLSAQSITSKTIFPASAAIDADGSRFFALEDGVNEADRLLVVDLTDGSLINSFILDTGNGAAVYHCAKNRLYFFTTQFLRSVNPDNGSTEVVLDFSLPIAQFLPNSLTLDESNDILYAIQADGGRRSLFSVNLESRVDQLNEIPGNPDLDHLIYACHENRFYGMENNVLEGLSPRILSTETISEIPNVQTTVDGAQAFNQAEAIYYFVGVDANDARRLYAVNALAGNFSATEPLSQTISNLAYANPCQALAQFDFDNLCSDNPVNFINNSVAGRYSWIFGERASGEENTSEEKSPSRQYAEPGVFNVSLTASTCSDSETVRQEIELIEPPDTLLAALYEKCSADQLILNASNPLVESFEWSTGAKSDSISAEEAGFYFVDATIGDCVKRYETEVADIPCPCRPVVPNAFTPNNDRTNDDFRPAFVEDYCEVLAYSMKIFNRWGQLVYETDDSMKPWNGEHNGNPAPSDVYLWIIEFSYIDKDSGQEGELETRKGDVALIR